MFDFDFNARPVDVTDIEIWRDGGTVSFVFVDAKGQRLPCFVGGKLRTDVGQMFTGNVGDPRDKSRLIAWDDAVYQDVISALERYLIYQVGSPQQQQEFERVGSVRDDIRIDNAENRQAWLLALALELMRSRADSEKCVG